MRRIPLTADADNDEYDDDDDNNDDDLLVDWCWCQGWSLVEETSFGKHQAALGDGGLQQHQAGFAPWLAPLQQPDRTLSPVEFGGTKTLYVYSLAAIARQTIYLGVKAYSECFMLTSPE